MAELVTRPWLRRLSANGCGGGWIGEVVGLAKPVRDRRFDFVTVSNRNNVGEFGFRRRLDAADLRRLHSAPEEDADLEVRSLWPDEEVARPAGEHDRVVRRVDALLTEVGRRLAHAFPGIAQVVSELVRQRRFGRRPAVVCLAFLDPLFAVIALSTRHRTIVVIEYLSRVQHRCHSGRCSRVLVEEEQQGD